MARFSSSAALAAFQQGDLAGAEAEFPAS